jgi:Uma2 family endonuclease
MNITKCLRAGFSKRGAPFELLDGHIVRKVRNAQGEGPLTIGARHTTAVSRLGDFNPRLKRQACYMRLQSPLTLPPNDEPEPDGAIVRGGDRDYIERHPGPADILCVVEVSDASIRRDRGYKLQLYAISGISMYVIVNLLTDTVEVRRNPLKGRYSPPEILSPRQKLILPTARGKGIAVPVKQLLP